MNILVDSLLVAVNNFTQRTLPTSQSSHLTAISSSSSTPKLTTTRIFILTVTGDHLRSSSALLTPRRDQNIIILQPKLVVAMITPLVAFTASLDTSNHNSLLRSSRDGRHAHLRAYPLPGINSNPLLILTENYNTAGPNPTKLLGCSVLGSARILLQSTKNRIFLTSEIRSFSLDHCPPQTRVLGFEERDPSLQFGDEGGLGSKLGLESGHRLGRLLRVHRRRP